MKTKFLIIIILQFYFSVTFSQKWINYSIPYPVTSIKFEKDTAWVCTYGGGIEQRNLDGSLIKRYSTPNGPISSNINTICADS